MADFTVKLTITGDGSVAVKAVKDVSQATAQMGAQAKQSGAASSQGFAIAARGAASLRAEVDQARSTIASLVAAAGGLSAVKSFAGAFLTAADAAGQLEARMRLATEGQQDYTEAMARMRDIAHSSFVSLNDIAEIYIRSIEPMRQLGYSTRETLDLTEAMSLALVVSAADAQKRASAVDVLSKVMQTGNVQMQEFVTLTTAAPRFVGALEQALGKTRAELIGMVSAGTLTAGELAKVGSELDKLRTEVEAMPTTVQDATTRFRDAFQEWAGATNETSGATANLVVAIGLLSQHIDGVMTVAIMASVAALAAGAHQVVAFVSGIVHQRAAAAEAAAATLAKAEATVVDTGATLANTQAAVANAQAKLASARSNSVAAVATAELAAAQTAQAAASAAHDAAQRALGEAIDSTRFKILSLSTAINVAAAATVGWQIGAYLRDQFEIVRLGAIQLVGDFHAAWNRIQQGAQIAWEAIKAVALGAINTIRGHLADLYGMYARFTGKLPGGGGLSEQLRSIESALRPTSSAADNFQAALDRINTTASDQSKSIWAVVADLVAYEKQATSAKDSATEFAQSGAVNNRTLEAALKQLTQSMAGHADKLAEQNFLIGKGASGQYEYAKAVALAKAATIEDAAARSTWIAEVNNLFNPLIAAAKANDALSQSHKGGVSAAQQAAKAGADYIDQLQKQIATFGLSSAATERYELGLKKLTPEQRALAETLIDTLEEWERYSKVLKPTHEAIDMLADGSADLDEELAKGRDKLAGLNAAQIKYNAGVREANQLARAALALGPPTAQAQREMEAHLTKLAELRDQDNSIEAADKKASDLDAMIQKFAGDEGIGSMNDALVAMQAELDVVGDKMGDAFDPKRVAELQNAIGNARHAIVTGIVGSAQEGLRSLQSMTEDGSKAFQGFQIAIDALAVVQAISAVLNQGQGDPYTAFARMAAMAAAVAQLGVSIGSFGSSGPSAQSAEVRQAQQGTGTVLGDAEAKSDSILLATEIIANATTQLVGLNRGMLNALESLQRALGAAGNQLARGAADVEFAPIGDNSSSGVGALFGAIGNWFMGGDREVIDQGIFIAGGRLTDMLNSIVVGAYQTIEEDGGWFGSDTTVDQVVDVSNSLGKQFSLVIGSIVDTVREAALALGLLPADIEAAIAAFQVEEIRISLSGLSAEEQQAELEAVFSSIFDGLAGSVVPWVEQFQAVGEGLGETLVRIATEVQVAQQAFAQLGLAVDESDPERFAQISDALIQAAGGLDSFIAGMQSFVANFAPEGHKFAVASDALASALAQVGLEVPSTRDGMWELMQSLDATTDAGREQIATLLRLADVADQYYTALDKQVSEATKLLEGMRLATGGLTEFGRSLVGIKQQEAAAVEAANLIAKAQGRQGASAIQVAQIHNWAAQQMAAAVRRLQMQIRDEIAELYGGIPGTLDAITARIAELEQGTETWSDSIDRVGAASHSLFESWAQGVQTVQEYLDSMLLGDLSGLSPEEQLSEAQRQLIAMQQAAAGGDARALNQLPQLADAYLRLLRGSAASGGDYNAGFDWVRQLLQSVVDLPNPGTGRGPDTGSPIGGGRGPDVSAELAALYAERDARMAEQEAEHRSQLAQQLAVHLGDMADALNVPILALIEAQGLNLATLAADLGVDLQNLNAASVEALGNMAVTLGASMTELTGALGITLTDLAGGLTELTASVGIDLQALTVESTQSLAALASSLGMDLAELSTAVGVDLGSLADAQSLLNQALAAEIQGLPADQAAALTPLLAAIAAATTEADANTAISALEEAVNAMGGSTANALAPYLQGVLPVRALNQLDFLSQLHDIASDQLDVLGLIRDNLSAANHAAGIPSYAVGTGYVRGDQLANIHHGEAVVPASINAWFRTANWQLPRGDASGDDRVLVALDKIRDRLDSLERTTANELRSVRDTTRSEHETDRSQQRDLARDDNLRRRA